MKKCKLSDVPSFRRLNENEINEISMERAASAYLKNQHSPNIQFIKKMKFTQAAIDDFNDKYGFDEHGLTIWAKIDEDTYVYGGGLNHAYVWFRYNAKVPTNGFYLPYPKQNEKDGYEIDKEMRTPDLYTTRGVMWEFTETKPNKENWKGGKPSVIMEFVKEIPSNRLINKIKEAVEAFEELREKYIEFCKKSQEESKDKPNIKGRGIPGWMH